MNLKSKLNKEEGYLTGQLLIAMPSMFDLQFAHTVIYICIHSPEGAMGLVLNRPVKEFSFPQLMQLLEVETSEVAREIQIYLGGPVESGRGFVLHSSEYAQSDTIVIDGNVCLTSTTDILRDIADNHGPKRSLIALGYTGWGPGQLDHELVKNSWLQAPADDALIFDINIQNKWKHSITKLGIDANSLSSEAGHA